MNLGPSCLSLRQNIFFSTYPSAWDFVYLYFYFTVCKQKQYFMCVVLYIPVYRFRHGLASKLDNGSFYLQMNINACLKDMRLVKWIVTRTEKFELHSASLRSFTCKYPSKRYRSFCFLQLQVKQYDLYLKKPLLFYKNC